MIFASCKVLLLISSGIRVTKHTALPTFSSYVTSHLQQGPADIVWQRVIDESARHYLELFPDISSSEEYQEIGRQMVSKYPGLGRQGLRYEWVSSSILCVDTNG